MRIRLATCECEEEIYDVVKHLEDNSKETDYIYWGNSNAWECDYVFVHLKGESEIKGVLKIRRVEDRKKINDFSNHRPKSWPDEMTYKKYYVVTKAKKVNFKRESLSKEDGQPLKTMHESVFVQCDDFVPF